MASFARGNPARWWKGRSCGGASRAPRALFISPFRRRANSAALLGLLLLLGGGWYVTNSSRVSRMSETLLSRVLGAKVSVRSGRVSFSGTLLLSGVEVRTADAGAAGSSPAADLPIFTAEQLEVRFDWLSLLSGKLTATQLVATTPVFRPIEDPNTGHWNYERLGIGAINTESGPAMTRPGGASGGAGMNLPVVILKDARVKWGEIHKGQVEQTAETVINGQLMPDSSVGSLYHFQLTQLAPADREGNSDDGRVIGAALQGMWDTSANKFVATMDDVTMTEALKKGMPRQAREWCEEHHLSGRLSELKLSYDPVEGLTLSFSPDGVSMITMVSPEQGISVGEDRPSYPLDVKNVRGQVVFTFTQPAIHIHDLRGEVLGYQFVADGDVQGNSFDYPFTLDLKFPKAVLGDRYPPLFMAFLTSQDLMQRVAPHGQMDIDVVMKRATKWGALTFNGAIDCHDARMRFAHFAYPMDHLNGRITFNEESVTFHDVIGKADENDVQISGTAGTTWGNRTIDFTVSSKNAAFDDRMAACLPEKFKDIWNLFSVRAHGGFVCRVTREKGKGWNWHIWNTLFDLFDQPRVVVDVDIDDGAGYLKTVPYFFSKASGHLHFEEDQTRIEHFSAVTGADGSGHVMLDGVVHHAAGDLEHLQPELKVKAEVPIDGRLMQALPEDLMAKLGGVKVGGRVAFDGTMRRGTLATDEVAGGTAGVKPASEIQVAGNVEWKTGSLAMLVAGDPVKMEGIGARGVISPDGGVEVKELAGVWQWPGKSGETGGVKLNMSGKWDGKLKGELSVALAGEGMALPEKLPGYVPESWREKWVAYSPAGRVDLDASTKVRLNGSAVAGTAGQPAEPFSVETYQIGIAAHDVSVKGAGWPDAVERINGSLEVAPGVVKMNKMQAAMGNLAMQWDGQYKPESGAVTLAGAVDSKGWPTKWMDHLPQALKEKMDLKREGVTLALKLTSLSREGEGKPWQYEGRLDTTNLAIKGEGGMVPMSAEHLNFVGKGSIDPSLMGRGEGFDFSGTLAATKLAVSDHVIETLAASMAASGPGHTVTLGDLDGKVADGRLQGSIQIFTAGGARAATGPATQVAATAPSTMPADGGYRAELMLSDAELSRLVLPASATEEERKKMGTGRVSATLTMQETFGAQGDRTGRGDLTVREGKFYNVPLSMGLMQVATLRLPLANSFQQATMGYYLRNNELTFERILLESPGINLAGMGTVSIKEREMNLNFVTETPHELFIPIISPIIQETRNEILQVSVTGTLDNPKVTPVPLSTLTNTLKALLPRPRADANK